MKILIQRVDKAAVEVSGELISKIEKGLLVFLGINKGDTKEEAESLAYRCINFRIFEDRNEKMNLSVSDVDGEILLVPQFTLSANCNKGHRPGFDTAAPPGTAKKLYLHFAEQLTERGIKPQLGEFGKSMQVNLTNNGPATFLLEKHV